MMQYLMSLAKPSPATTPPLDGELGPSLPEVADAISGTAGGGGGGGGLAPIAERPPGGGERVTFVVEGAKSMFCFPVQREKEKENMHRAFCGDAVIGSSLVAFQHLNNATDVCIIPVITEQSYPTAVRLRFHSCSSILLLVASGCAWRRRRGGDGGAARHRGGVPHRGGGAC